MARSASHLRIKNYLPYMAVVVGGKLILLVSVAVEMIETHLIQTKVNRLFHFKSCSKSYEGGCGVYVYQGVA